MSAILIAILFSLWNDYIYKKDQLTGYWSVESRVIKTSYKKYQGLKTNYDFIIGQIGNALNGTGEKISEDSVNGIVEYDADKRPYLEFTGTLTYRVFSKNKVDIVYKEYGRQRSSSTIMNLIVESNEKMTGTFISTIASSNGEVTFTRRKEL